MIVAVAGLSRCGTTLMMHMLHEGGMEVYCDNKVSYETDNIMKLPGDSTWMSDCEGKAVKLLDPHKNVPSKDHKYVVIWMRRDYKQQAKSQAKLAHLLDGLPKIGRKDIRRVESKLHKETVQCMSMFSKQYKAEIHITEFEDVLHNPIDSAVRIADILKIHKIELSPMDMAVQVIDRDTDCYDGLMETEFLNRDN